MLIRGLPTRNIVFISLLLAVAFTLVACGGGPSKGTCKKAIKATVERQVPISWSGSTLGGKNTRVDSVKIVAIGKPQEIFGSKVWPVKIRVKGTCDANLLTTTRRNDFDQVGEFYVHKDSYGEWKVEHHGF